MTIYVGITDSDWFQFLRARRAEEMNFWRPKNTADFRALKPGELFLFKTKFPENRIVGGAIFVRHTTLPLDLAWETFGEANGVASAQEFRLKINSHRKDDARNPVIGCTVLTQPFYFEPETYLRAPSDWPTNVMTGKCYDSATGEGRRLFDQVRLVLSTTSSSPDLGTGVAEDKARYGEGTLIYPRLGQGGFRVVVMDEYQRRCAMTGERTLPVLEAAHIRPYAEEGPHEVGNGLFLRSDLHTLFDGGYLTVTNDYHIEVSRRIRDEFENGRHYYALHGQMLAVIPKNASHRPAPTFLEWHQNNRFLSS